MTEESQPTFYGGLTLPSGAVNLYGTQLALQNEMTSISYIGPSGTVYYLSGPAAPIGATGVLLNSFMGLMAPWNMLELKGARQDGATWTGAVYDPTDIQLHLELSGNSPWEIRNLIRRWVGDWDPRNGTGILSVWTPELGEWWANVRMAKTMPDMFKQDFAWTGRQQFTWEIKNYNAFWRGVDSTSTFSLAYDSASVDWTKAPNASTLGSSWTQYYSQSGEGTLGVLDGAAQWYPTANQAPQFDAIGAGTDTNSGSATSYTWSHSVTSSGVSPALLVSFITNGSVSAVTFNGVEATELAHVAMPGSSGGTAYLYGLLAPSTGTHNVVVTLLASAYLDGNSTSYTNVYGFGPAATNSGNAIESAFGATLSVAAPFSDMAAATYFNDFAQFANWNAHTRWEYSGTGHWNALSGDYPGQLLGNFFDASGGDANWAAVGVDLQAIQFVNNVNVYTTGSATDNQVVTITLADATFANLFDFLSGGYIDVWGRLNSAGTTGVRLRIGEGFWRLSCFNSGVETLWATLPMVVPPIWGETFTLICGTNSGTNNYLLLRDGNQFWSYTDTAGTAQVGSSYRDWGFGVGLGIDWVTNQESAPCPLSKWSANDNLQLTESGFCPLTNIGDQPAWPRYLCYGPGTFTIANGPGGKPISFGPLYEGQIALITTDPRLPSVIDLTPNQTTQQLNAGQQLLQEIISLATNNNVPPLLQQFESWFGILPPQGNFYSLLSGRFTNPIEGATPGVAPVAENIAVSITDGSPQSQIIAAITPMRRWPL